MKKLFISQNLPFLKMPLSFLMIHLLCFFNAAGYNDDNPRLKKLLPPPTPTVVLTLPTGSNCFSTLTASGCGTASTYWYTGNNYYSNANPLVVNVSTPVILKAVCYDGTFGDYSPEYKAVSATYTQITPISSVSFCPGGSVTLNASSAFSGLTYQWRLNNSNISGATDATYNASTAGNYTVYASNASCNSTSIVKVVNQTSVSTPFISTSFTGTCGNQTVLMTTQSLPSGTFQWKLNGTNISGATMSSYSTNVAGSYTVEYTSTASGCVTTSNAYNFVQNTIPNISLNPPVSPSSCGSTLNATGCSGAVWWQRNDGSSWTYVSYGANPYAFPSSTNPPEYRATCYLNGCESSPSNALKATPNNFTEITPKMPATICSNSSVLLNASSTFSGLTYQWRLNGSNISGATSSSYSATLAGNYQLFVTNGSCTFLTATTTVSVTTAPTLSITSSVTSPATIVNGQSLTLTANGCSGGTILWSNSATTSSISVSPSSNTTYTFTCTQSPCTVISDGFVVNVNSLLPPTLTSSAVSTCTGSSVTLTATACQGGGTVTWSTSQTGQSISVSPSTTTNYTATCTVGSVTSVNSSPISISVFDGVITSLASGDWNTPATWSCNCIPAACNDVIVDTGHLVTIPATEKGRLQNLTLRGTVDVKTTGTMALK